MKWYHIALSTDVIRSVCTLLLLSEVKQKNLLAGLGRRYHLFIREDCTFFMDRLITCPVKASAVTLDELNILLLDKTLKD